VQVKLVHGLCAADRLISAAIVGYVFLAPLRNFAMQRDSAGATISWYLVFSLYVIRDCGENAADRIGHCPPGEGTR
jgi:hypothetical protein